MAKTFVKINLRGIKLIEGDMQRLITAAGMGTVGIKALELNNNQIESQVDRNNKKFKPYSKRYKAYRAKRGRDQRVDLIGFPTAGGGSATMLQSFQVQRTEPGRVVIGFPNSVEKIKALGEFENKKRPVEFVGLNSNSRRKLQKYIFTHFHLNRK